MITLYMFYLGKELYAFTDNKRLAHMFEEVRTKRFKKIKTKIDEEDREYRLFRAQHSDMYLFETPIECKNYAKKGNDSKKDSQGVINVVVTPKENTIFDERMKEIDDKIYRASLVISSNTNPLKPEYTEILKDLQGITYLELDLLDIFIDLFSETFDVPEKSVE